MLRSAKRHFICDDELALQPCRHFLQKAFNLFKTTISSACHSNILFPHLRSCFNLFVTWNWHPGAILASLALGKGTRPGKALFGSMPACSYPPLFSELVSHFYPYLCPFSYSNRQSLLHTVFATAPPPAFCSASRGVAPLCKLQLKLPLQRHCTRWLFQGVQERDHIKAKVFEDGIRAYNPSVRRPLPRPCHKSPGRSV